LDHAYKLEDAAAMREADLVRHRGTYWMPLPFNFTGVITTRDHASRDEMVHIVTCEPNAVGDGLDDDLVVVDDQNIELSASHDAPLTRSRLIWFRTGD
jgi:hypothetical protein